MTNKDGIKIFNIVEEIKGYQKKIATLNEMNTKNYNNYCDAIKKINELKNEIEKDKMEQFDDYVIYLLEKYLKRLGEE